MELARAVHTTRKILARSSFCFFGLMLFSNAAAGQPAVVLTRPAGIVHQYPMTGARDVPPVHDIGIRAIGVYDRDALAKQSFSAIGSVSGAHPLSVHLSRDRTMAIFHSATPYAYGEEVRFAMSGTLAGGMAISDSIHFSTMIRPAPANIQNLLQSEHAESSFKKTEMRAMSVESDSLPALSVTVDDSAVQGTIYFDNFGYLEGSAPIPNACYNITTDEHGVITQDVELVGESSRDYKPQPNGLRTYYDINAGAFIGIDSAGNSVDTFAAQNYGTDQHELRVFPDGSYALLGISISFVDLSQIPNGADSAEVLGDVIQTFDPDGNLLFEWRGIDHYNVLDSKYEDLTAYAIDFEHANSLDFDSTGNILLSNRHLCEISNINGVTGDFVWRLGGAHNQFTLIGDSIWFSFQHDALWIPSGNMTIFDNSNYDTVTGGNGDWIQQSRAIEFQLDTVGPNKTATEVWQYHHTPETWSDAMGSVTRLPNGNTFIGWGDDTSVSMTEVRPDKTTAFELQMLNGNVSYRAIKSVPDFGIIGILDTTGFDSTAGVSASAAQASGNTLEIQNGLETSPAMLGTLSAVFSLGESQLVTLTIYDMTGRAVRNILPSQWEASGNHEIPLDLSGLPNGAYECALTIPTATLVRSFTMLK